MDETRIDPNALYYAPYYKDVEAENFWIWFAKHEKELRTAKSDQDSSIIMLQDKLRTINPDLTFKLGWTDDSLEQITHNEIKTGTREIAIATKNCNRKACEKAQSLVINARFKDAIPYFQSTDDVVRISPNWCVALGDHPAQPFEAGLQISNTRVDFKKPKFVATKNGDFIDVAFYSDYPESDKINLRSPYGAGSCDIIDVLIERMLGDYLFENNLGTVSMHALKDAPDSALPILQMEKIFDGLLTESQTESRDSIVCKRDVSSITMSPAKRRHAQSWIFQCHHHFFGIRLQPVLKTDVEE